MQTFEYEKNLQPKIASLSLSANLIKAWAWAQTWLKPEPERKPESLCRLVVDW